MKKIIFTLLLLIGFSAFSQEETKETPIAITQSSSAHFSIYPNPVEDQLSINTKLSDYSFEVINSIGQVVAKQKNKHGLEYFDYSNFPSGIYILKLTSGDITESFKIVRL